ncbi:YuzF family protein [Jeotgalibacillus terrae]|uniref:YuzF family protein n=1 Tax=Jeotgalibacillus terrae TaxID=587735 RepID=A0ABW5ZF81_9BACL|nr:YuzF family protein [Jeotgalibacillus terrae]MBM7579027.1 anthranilate/para-aminobenzoate synthase component II [Jeotgalibacillus terrae]
MNSQETTFVSNYDPFVYQAVNSLIGSMITVQTTKNPVQGMLTSAAPDHIVIEINKVPFFIRTQQIVWISPS